MKCSPADAELLGCRGYVAVRRGQRLHDQFSLCLMQIERACFFAESLGSGNAARRDRAGGLADSHRQIAQCDFWAGRHYHTMLDRATQLANVAGPIVSE